MLSMVFGGTKHEFDLNFGKKYCLLVINK